MRPLLPEAGGTIAAVERWGPSAIERKLVALERRRAKLVPMLAMHRMSAARRARLRQQLANVDEMIRLMKRTHCTNPLRELAAALERCKLWGADGSLTTQASALQSR
jgi:hypothetical protein